VTRRAPPPIPQKGPRFVITSKQVTPPGDTGPELTAGERFLEELSATILTQRFDYYYCPHCDAATSLWNGEWQCESCGERFAPDDIRNQVEMPDVRVPYSVAFKLMESIQKILRGVDPREALDLKPGRKRLGRRDALLQRTVAERVREICESNSDVSLTVACEQAAGECAHLTKKKDLSARTVLNWYRRLFPDEE